MEDKFFISAEVDYKLLKSCSKSLVSLHGLLVSRSKDADKEDLTKIIAAIVEQEEQGLDVLFRFIEKLLDGDKMGNSTSG